MTLIIGLSCESCSTTFQYVENPTSKAAAMDELEQLHRNHVTFCDATFANGLLSLAFLEGNSAEWTTLPTGDHVVEEINPLLMALFG